MKAAVLYVTMAETTVAPGALCRPVPDAEASAALAGLGADATIGLEGSDSEPVLVP